ncbi:hypothetical protein LAZ67_18000028 [Cordylochernes scorpioides]|uniref:Transposase n=1 Tax=Cordylochernes scorpioides TaxID=51811 RepID=A0ABY6LEQ2_9ARAC|nr:hypothetical protein LAZ67_18000028 [Cordylochernes scorpioides]
MTLQREQLFLNGILDLKLAEFPLKMNLGKDAQNVQKITDLIKENPRNTLLELEQDTGISKTTIGRIVTKDLKLKKTPAKFIPRFLTNEQKLCRLATCENMLEMTRTDPEWKDKIITGDETWVYDYDPETKRQYAEWRGQGEPRPKKSRILKSRNKVLLVAFLDNKGIVHHEYLPAGQTIIKEMYLDILRHLREAIRKKCQKNGLMVTGSYTITMPALTQRTWTANNSDRQTQYPRQEGSSVHLVGSARLTLLLQPGVTDHRHQQQLTQLCQETAVKRPEWAQ